MLIAYSAGLLAYSPASQRGWMLPLWHFFYGSMLLLLILLGVYDGWSSGISQQVRDMIVALHEFLISPLPFVVMGLIARLVKQKDAT